MLRATLPALLRNAGRFTPEEIGEYKKAWKKPGAIHAMTNYYRAMRKYRGDLKQLVKKIDVPTLLIWADHEPVFLREASENFDEWVPNLRVARIRRAGHSART